MWYATTIVNSVLCSNGCTRSQHLLTFPIRDPEEGARDCDELMVVGDDVDTRSLRLSRTGGDLQGLRLCCVRICA